MKKTALLAITWLTVIFTFASELVFIPTGSLEKTREAFGQKDLTIHFYNDDFAIGTAINPPAMAYQLLDNDAWGDGTTHYYILYFDPGNREDYFKDVRNVALTLHQGDNFLVVAADRNGAAQLYPAIRGGMVHFSQAPAGFPANSLNYTPGTLSARDDISSMVAQVDTAHLRQMVQHLEDYGNRNCYKPEGILAQNWIYSKFDSLGLDVELHDFYMPGGAASDNVIATQTGTKYPDEYVVLGAHYDTYASGNTQPGADDNATGTAGIIEIARILSQYEFDRSIIYATWSGEEYGLYGSAAWASEAAADSMNILGYFNIDMAGYLQPGSYIHTDLIGPSSANELKEFYRDVCAIYLPDFIIENGAMSGGDSDHTSFNNNGYQGIFPFEDSQNYSPYIHTSNDRIGPSVNNFEQHGIFVKAILANVASMANMLPSPENLVAMAGDAEVSLEWTGVDSVDYYNIYRDLDPEPYDTSSEAIYVDVNVENGTLYSYYITAVFLTSGEESGPSNLVTAVPMPPIALPFFDDFETGALYWTAESTWGLRPGIYYSEFHSITESPVGNYQANMNASMTLRSIDLTGATSAQISFWTRYRIETNYDFMYLEVSTDGSNWSQMASFTGIQNDWVQKTYSLNDYINQTNVMIRFRFYSDTYVQDDGMYIDDLEIMISGVGLDEGTFPFAAELIFQPNPARNMVTAGLYLKEAAQVKIQLCDVTGRLLQSVLEKHLDAGQHQLELDISDLPGGVYIGTMETAGQRVNRKLVIH
ncbi:MAG: M28 family peptidase [Bacteroidales bacterium]